MGQETNCPMASLQGEGPTTQGSQRAQRTRAGAAFASRKQELFIANDAHHKVNTGRATLSAKQNGRSGTIRHAKEGGPLYEKGIGLCRLAQHPILNKMPTTIHSAAASSRLYIYIYLLHYSSIIML